MVIELCKKRCLVGLQKGTYWSSKGHLLDINLALIQMQLSINSFPCADFLLQNGRVTASKFVEVRCSSSLLCFGDTVVVFPSNACLLAMLFSESTLNPNRSLEPEQILFYCRADWTVFATQA